MGIKLSIIMQTNIFKTLSKHLYGKSSGFLLFQIQRLLLISSSPEKFN